MNAELNKKYLFFQFYYKLLSYCYFFHYFLSSLHATILSSLHVFGRDCSTKRDIYLKHAGTTEYFFRIPAFAGMTK